MMLDDDDEDDDDDELDVGETLNCFNLGGFCRVTL